MQARFKGKKVLVTGGSRGIGRRIAEDFMEEGAKVVITYNKNCPEDLTKRGIVCYKCDVSNREEVRQLSREVRERVGEIDVLVNNAGIMYSMPFESYDEGKFDEMIKVNIKG